jgi:hypothetical protein
VTPKRRATPNAAGSVTHSGAYAAVEDLDLRLNVAPNPLSGTGYSDCGLGCSHRHMTFGWCSVLT